MIDLDDVLSKIDECKSDLSDNIDKLDYIFEDESKDNSDDIFNDVILNLADDGLACFGDIDDNDMNMLYRKARKNGFRIGKVNTIRDDVVCIKVKDDSKNGFSEYLEELESREKFSDILDDIKNWL